MTNSRAEEVRRLILTLLIEHGGGEEEAQREARDVDLTADIEVDSLHMVEIVIELEEALGIEIPHDDLTAERLRSVELFVEYLAARDGERERTASNDEGDDA